MHKHSPIIQEYIKYKTTPIKNTETTKKAAASLGLR